MRKIKTFGIVILTLACTKYVEDLNIQSLNIVYNLNNQNFKVAEHSPAYKYIGINNASYIDGNMFTYTIISYYDIIIKENRGELLIATNLNLLYKSTAEIIFPISVFEGKLSTQKDLILEFTDNDEVSLLDKEHLEYLDFQKYSSIFKDNII